VASVTVPARGSQASRFLVAFVTRAESVSAPDFFLGGCSPPTRLLIGKVLTVAIFTVVPVPSSIASTEECYFRL
jgi:hypothetical protein